MKSICLCSREQSFRRGEDKDARDGCEEVLQHPGLLCQGEEGGSRVVVMGRCPLVVYCAIVKAGVTYNCHTCRQGIKMTLRAICADLS